MIPYGYMTISMLQLFGTFHLRDDLIRCAYSPYLRGLAYPLQRVHLRRRLDAVAQRLSKKVQVQVESNITHTLSFQGLKAGSFQARVKPCTAPHLERGRGLGDGVGEGRARQPRRVGITTGGGA